MPQLLDLRVLVAAVDEGSLSAAARSLGRTPAAASASLKRLESELDMKLVERSTRALRLTPEGRIYHGRVVRALAMLDEGEALLRHAGERVEGELRIAAPPDLVRVWLRAELDAFQAEHPDVRILLHVGDTVRHLVREPIDIAIRYGELPDSSLVMRRLVDNHRLPVAAPAYLDGHPPLRHPNDLLDHNCLVFHSRNAPLRRWRLRRGRETVTVDVQGDRVCDDGGIVRDWALDGVGIAYKSELDVRSELAAGRLARVLPEWQGEPVPLNAVYPGQGPRPPRVARLVEFLARRLRSQERGR